MVADFAGVAGVFVKKYKFSFLLCVGPLRTFIFVITIHILKAINFVMCACFHFSKTKLLLKMRMCIYLRFNYAQCSKPRLRQIE